MTRSDESAAGEREEPHEVCWRIARLESVRQEAWRKRQRGDLWMQ